ncbi:MAG: hypothetical protein RLZZ517_530 [Candidatus Parcubacteria bacterium]|jgi:glycosyltransferase involved in cell wall biosynthesis
MDSNIKKQPLVSVTICTYNRANFIMQAIHSIEEQTYKNIEIIIVDDASTDNTEELIKNYSSPLPIRYFKNKKNLNIAGTRNETIRHSSGEYIAILDSDDFWLDKEKISKQVTFLESNPDFVLVGTHAQAIDANGTITGEFKNPLSAEEIKKVLLIKDPFVHSSVVYRKRLLPENPFNKTKSPFEDYELMLRLGRKYKMQNLDILGIAYRIHSDGESKKLTFKKKMTYLFILIKNIPYYPGFFVGIRKRLFHF